MIISVFILGCLSIAEHWLTQREFKNPLRLGWEPSALLTLKPHFISTRWNSETFIDIHRSRYFGRITEHQLVCRSSTSGRRSEEKIRSVSLGYQVWRSQPLRAKGLRTDRYNWLLSAQDNNDYKHGLIDPETDLCCSSRSLNTRRHGQHSTNETALTFNWGRFPAKYCLLTTASRTSRDP